jgi:hypothetical protein
VSFADRTRGVVSVTGGSSRLGAAVAGAARGGTPVVLDLHPPEAPWQHVPVDVTDPADTHAS